MALLIRNSKMPEFKHRPHQFEQGRSITLPAPYGGINLRSDITALAQNEARVLENWDTTAGQLVMRQGFEQFAEGMGSGEVKTLAAFVGYSATALLAAANGKIYDATLGTYDPGNDTFTKVYLPLNGTDASTTITDSNLGGAAHVWTAAGNAQIDTADSKFGGASLLLDGTGDYVSTPDHANFALGSSDFTIDCWFKCNVAGGSYRAIAGQVDAGGTQAGTGWWLRRHTSNVMEFVFSDGTNFGTITGTTSFTDAVNTGWHHIAVARSGTTMRMFIDGDQEGGDLTILNSINNSTEDLVVGRLGAIAGQDWTGWIDEFRLSVGTARWTDDFEAPTGPYSPLELATGFSENRWQTAVYGDRLFFVNGTDNPQVYNGTTVSGIVWAGSGLTDNDLINIALVRNRLWFCEKNKADVWYGAVGQITAASNLTKFELSQIAGGGFCMAIGSWSRDGGDGADDLTVFVMSTGEILVYQGDPGSTFSLIGKYKTGAAPIGRQCLVNVGGELIVITRLGLLPLSAAVGGVALDLSKIDPWGKVAPGIVDDARLHGDKSGWHGCLHLGTLFINVPQSEGAISKQWVLNTRTGAWTTHTGRNPSSICSFNNELYFGAQTGGVVNIIFGPSDDGADITATANGAFVFPNNAQKDNLFTAIRPRFQASGAVSGLVGVDTDFATRTLSGEAVNIVNDPSTTPWGSEWGSPWGQPAGPAAQWYTIRGEGKAVSVKLRAVGATQEMKWSATDVLFKPGGIR